MAHFQPGTYVCKITEQGFGESKEKKTPFFAVKFKVVSLIDQTTGDEVQVEGYDRDAKLWLTDNTIDNALKSVRGLGYTGHSFRELDPDVPGHHSFVGDLAQFVCKHEEYDGKQMERWEFPGPGFSAKPIERVAGLSKKLDTLFGKQIKSGATHKPKPTAAKPPAAAPASNDEIPF